MFFTTLAEHTIVRAIQRNITEAMIDNVLGEISSGMNAVQKYYDMQENSRIMYDPNNKTTVVIGMIDNIIITVYDADQATVADRVSSKRWVKGSFTYK